MSKQVKYTGRDFNSLKSQLLEFAKQYFPDKFNNWNDYSIEMLYTEMASYVGDSLHFNIDEKFRNNFMQYADEAESVFRLAKERGYSPQTVSVAVGTVEFSQEVPAVLSGSVYEPDVSYAGVVNSGTIVSNANSSNRFEVIDTIDMDEYTDSVVVETGSGGEPVTFRIFKDTRVRSGQRQTKNISVSSFQTNLELFVDSNVAYIESVTDAEGNDWFEVEYLAQDTVFESVENSGINNNFSPFSDETPFLIRARRQPRRFVVDHRSTGDAYLQFGQGVDIIDNTLKGLTTDDFLTTNEIANYNLSNTFLVDNFLNNDSLGLVPSNTTLTVTYIVSRGNQDNASSNSLTTIASRNITFPNNSTPDVVDSFAVSNPDPVSGASFLNSIDRIKRESTEAFASQRRCVTIRDYIIRSKMLPNKFGNVDKVYAEKDINYYNLENQNLDDQSTKTINIYTLSKDVNGDLTETNVATKNNLRVFLNEFRMATDSIHIRDAYIVNIGVYFEFVAKKDFNKEQVAFNISRKIEEHFDIDKWEMNQPIVLEDLRFEMLEAKGVASVSNIDFENKIDTSKGYSGVQYNVSVDGENFDKRRGILYPPADISIFEMRFPLNDIKSKAL